MLAPHRQPPRLHSSQRRGKPFFNYGFSQESAAFCDFALRRRGDLEHAVRYAVGRPGATSGLRSMPTATAWPRPVTTTATARARPHPAARAARAPTPACRWASTRSPSGRSRGAACWWISRIISVAREQAHRLGTRCRHAMAARRHRGRSRGDVLCIHTGFAAELLEDAAPARRAESVHSILRGAGRVRCPSCCSGYRTPGCGPRSAADNYAVEAVTPPGDPAADKYGAVAPPLPVQARHPARRVVALVRARRVAAAARAPPLFSVGAAIALARSSGLTGDAGGDGLVDETTWSSPARVAD